MKTKYYFFYLLALSFTCLITACGGDDDDVKGIDINVIIHDDGTTSNGSRFSAIDDKNFYLDYIKYSVEEGHLKVSGYDSKGFHGEAKIAHRVSFKGNSYDVLEIGRNAFRDCTILTSITMPNNVTTINAGAFYGCTGLTSITMPNNVTYIGEYNQEIKGVTNVEIIPVSA